ncbi:protein crossbronx homolog [Fopius arisanus]|uniref:Protein crossbronx homolog n=1 Tax=Fopius arisanus TaxID=64838 RepID=A0A9R1U9Y7_9HYME|nr:PREDICTED: protein crossbronx homolog [Fopius arisanus]
MNVKGAGSSSKEEGDEGLKRQGSFRKILPGGSGGDSQLNTSIRMIDRPQTISGNGDHLVYLQEYNILAEYHHLQQHDLRGIYVIPSAESSFVWFGVLFVNKGFYRGAVFRFTITLPENFPDGGCPKVAFESKVFHPLIYPETNELNTSAGFPEWKKNNRIYQLIQFIVKVFNKVDGKLPSTNSEASTLLCNNVESFKSRVRECILKSLDHLYDPPETNDPHYLTFTSWWPELHELTRQKIFQPKKQEPERTPTGFSWVQPGSLQPLSKLEDPAKEL